MVKSIISAIIASLTLILASYFEQTYIKNTFDELKDNFVLLFGMFDASGNRNVSISSVLRNFLFLKY